MQNARYFFRKCPIIPRKPHGPGAKHNVATKSKTCQKSERTPHFWSPRKEKEMYDSSSSSCLHQPQPPLFVLNLTKSPGMPGSGISSTSSQVQLPRTERGSASP